MMLFARIFELLDEMEGEELQEAVQHVSDHVVLWLAMDNFAHGMLVNYLAKRGVPSDAPLYALLKDRITIWNDVSFETDISPETLR